LVIEIEDVALYLGDVLYLGPPDGDVLGQQRVFVHDVQHVVESTVLLLGDHQEVLQ